MEGIALPRAPLYYRHETLDFSVTPAHGSTPYIVSAQDEKMSYPYSQIIEIHNFIQAPGITSVLGWFGIRSLQSGSHYSIEIPTAAHLSEKITTLNTTLDYGIPPLFSCNTIISESDYLQLHSQTILPVCEQPLQTSAWEIWHSNIHDLLTHVTTWILAPESAHNASTDAARQAVHGSHETKLLVSDAVDDFYTIEGLGNCIQASSFETLLDSPNHRSVWRTMAYLGALSMPEFDLCSFWKASQQRIRELHEAIITL